MDRWFDLIKPDDELPTIIEKMSKETELDKDKLSAEQIEHIIESIQYAGLEKGSWFITLYDNVQSSGFIPTSGIINYLIAFVWLRNHGWYVKWRVSDEWVDVMLIPPDGGY